MAFQTGSQINPALGAINYTPYLQGSLAGSQAIGQGIANLGQGIASGIEQYQKQKKENKAIDAENKANHATIESLGGLIKTLPKEYQDGYASILTKLNDPNLSRVEQQALSRGALDYIGKSITYGLPKVEQERVIKEKNNIALAEAGLSNEGNGPVPLTTRAAKLLAQGIQPYQIAEAQKLIESKTIDQAKLSAYMSESELNKAKANAASLTNQYSAQLSNAISKNTDFITGAIDINAAARDALKNGVPIDEVSKYVSTFTPSQPKPVPDTAEIKNTQFKNKAINEYRKLLKEGKNEEAYYYSIANDLGFVEKSYLSNTFSSYDDWLKMQNTDGKAPVTAPVTSKASDLKLPSGVTYKSTTK